MYATTPAAVRPGQCEPAQATADRSFLAPFHETLRPADQHTHRFALLRWATALALSGALATGVLQAAWLAWRLHVNGALIFRPRDFGWMTPASYVVPFVAATLVTALVMALVKVALRRWRPRLDARVGLAAVALFVGALALILLIPGLHPAARLLLAIGVAARTARPLARVAERTLWLSSAALLLLVALYGGGERVARARSERNAIASLPAAPDGAPSVLLLILDTVRAKSLSLYGYARETTPALVRWAGEGTTFDNAFSTAPWTLPSHSSIFTGRLPRELSAGELTPLDGRFPTLAEVFAERGYVTGGFVANFYYAGHDSGLDRGFAHFDDYRTTWKQVVWSSSFAQTELFKKVLWRSRRESKLQAVVDFDLTLDPLRYGHRKPGALVTDAFLEWEQRRNGRPYFAFLNYFDAHAAYKPLPRLERLFSKAPTPLDNYEACIRGLDDELDRLFVELQRRGTLDNTIVVVTSDHGEYFGEHGRTGHGNGLHLPVLRVPLVIRYPGRVPAGVRVEDPVSLRDLPSTLVSLAGGAPDRFPTPSLSRFWDGAATRGSRELVESGHADESTARLPRDQRRYGVSLVSDSLHWMRAFDGTESLYAYRADSDERRNLLNEPPFRAALDAMRAAAPDLRRP